MFKYVNKIQKAVLSLAIVTIASAPVYAHQLRHDFQMKKHAEEVFFGFGKNKEKEAQQRAQQQAQQQAEEDSPAARHKYYMENTKPIHYIPMGNKQLEFEMRIPKTWDENVQGSYGSQALNKKLMLDVAEYAGPIMKDIRPKINIQALQMEHEMMAEHWLKNHSLINGYTLQNLTAESDYRASASYVYYSNRHSFFITITAQIHGDMIGLASFSVPIVGSSNPYAKLQEEVTRSFKFISISSATIEKRKSIIMPEALSLEYPASWKLENQAIKDVNRMSLDIHNRSISDNLDGLIHISAIRRLKGITGEIEEKRLIQNIIDSDPNGLKINGEPKTQTPPAYRRFPITKQDVYLISYERNIIDQELWITKYENEDWIVFFVLFTPVSAQGFYDWARNTRTLELILFSIE